MIFENETESAFPALRIQLYDVLITLVKANDILTKYIPANIILSSIISLLPVNLVANLAYNLFKAEVIVSPCTVVIESCLYTIKSLMDYSFNDITDIEEDVNELAEKLKDTGWTQIGTTGTYYRKIGNEVYVKGSVPQVVSNSWSVIATLPEGYRPIQNLYRCLYGNGSTAITNICANANGNILYVTPAANGIANYYVSFLID